MLRESGNISIFAKCGSTLTDISIVKSHSVLFANIASPCGLRSAAEQL